MQYSRLTWEQSVLWLRQQPAQDARVRACYYDDPLIEAAQRFAASAEWRASRDLIPRPPGRALDLGAGRGISSYALACDGWTTIALEPDPSPIVGSNAIHTLAEATGLPIYAVENYAETLPFANSTFDLIYARQFLHHARDLEAVCYEIARVLKRGGWFLATREHVISRSRDLKDFLANHPLHHLYGGENAFRLCEYREALSAAGLRLVQIMGPFENQINYSPMTEVEMRGVICRFAYRAIGAKPINQLLNERYALGRWLFGCLKHWASRLNRTPGRLYSFLLIKDA